jgi:hypothetical protein
MGRCIVLLSAFDTSGFGVNPDLWPPLPDIFPEARICQGLHRL